MTISQASEAIMIMSRNDLQLRDELIKQNELKDDYHPRMKSLHDANQKRLQEIMDIVGFPFVERVGVEASKAAWLIIQHSINHPEFMKHCLSIMEAEGNLTEIEQQQMAYLSDRIAVFQGNPQKFGTQFEWNDAGEQCLAHYDDIEKVNERRLKVGLSSTSELLRNIKKRADFNKLQAPADIKDYQKRYDQWRREVGWI